MPIPIIFIHQGWGQYLEIALIQARRSNPDSPVFLLGSGGANHLKGVTCIDEPALWQSAADFAPLYHHLSGSNREFELFCLQRWFLLSAFLESHNIPRCFFLDSDVLLFGDVSREAERFSGCDLTHLAQSGPLAGYINSVPRLGEFCQHITRSYTHDLSRWTQWFADFRARGLVGGLSDMTIFHDFRAQFPPDSPLFADLSAIREGTAHDHNINTSDGYQMRHRRKRLRWQNGFPHAFHLESQQWICFQSLHFQGFAKPLMRGAQSANRAQWLQAAAQIEWHYLLRRVRNRWHRFRSSRY